MKIFCQSIKKIGKPYITLPVGDEIIIKRGKIEKKKMTKINNLLFYLVILCVFLIYKELKISCNKIECKFSVVEEGYNITICNENLKSVVDIMEPKKRTWFKLHLANKKIKSIATGAFKNLQIKSLRLELSPQGFNLERGSFSGIKLLENLEILSGIIALESNSFNGLSSLRALTLSINTTRENFKKSLEELVLLENLKIVNSDIQKINKNTFFKIYSAIVRLDLTKNGINLIDSNSFDNLKSLETLIIDENGLKIIQENAFNGVNKLLKLSLKSNKLKIITKNMFKGLNRLSILDLSDNLIASVEENSFNLLNISTINLSFNKLTTIKRGIFNGAKSLKDIYLNNNHISKIDDYAFSTLALGKLNLKNNQLTKIDANDFHGLLTYLLDLSDNNIDDVGDKKPFLFSIVQSIILNDGLFVDKIKWGLGVNININYVQCLDNCEK